MVDHSPLDGDEFDYLYQLYHKNLTPFVSEPGLGAERSPTTSAPESGPKTYRRAERIPLAETEQSAFLDRLRQRASYSRPTAARPITETELAPLLGDSYGELRTTESGDPRRPVPSGGACYPLELYPIVLDSPDLAAGIYHFNVQDRSLDRLHEGEYTDWVRDTWTWVGADDEVAAVVVITALPARTADKYGEMGYLFCGIETGAVIQNLQLVATELGIGSRPHNGLDSRALRGQLRLRDDEYLMSSVVFAGPDSSESE